MEDAHDRAQRGQGSGVFGRSAAGGTFQDKLGKAGGGENGERLETEEEQRKRFSIAFDGVFHGVVVSSMAF
jgi:hypothetical protein